MKPYTRQTAFDAALRGLRKQGRPSLEDDRFGLCRYRGADGCKCAVGFLIPDENYHPGLEDISLSGGHEDVILDAIPHEPEVTATFLVDMQSKLHDKFSDEEMRFPALLEEGAANFAKLWSLQYKPPVPA